MRAETNTDLELAVLDAVATRQRALLERITVLERALEKIEIQSFDANAKRMAREALDG